MPSMAPSMGYGAVPGMYPMYYPPAGGWGMPGQQPMGGYPPQYPMQGGQYPGYYGAYPDYSQQQQQQQHAQPPPQYAQQPYPPYQ